MPIVGSNCEVPHVFLPSNRIEDGNGCRSGEIDAHEKPAASLRIVVPRAAQFLLGDEGVIPIAPEQAMLLRQLLDDAPTDSATQKVCRMPHRIGAAAVGALDPAVRDLVVLSWLRAWSGSSLFKWATSSMAESRAGANVRPDIYKRPVLTCRQITLSTDDDVATFAPYAGEGGAAVVSRYRPCWS